MILTSFPIDGRVLRLALNALPGTPETPRPYANEFIPKENPEDPQLYRRRINLAQTPSAYPLHADLVYAEIRKQGDEAWQVSTTFGPEDNEWSFISPEGEIWEVRYRASNPNGDVTGPITTVS